MIALTTDVLAEINGLSPATDIVGARDFPFGAPKSGAPQDHGCGTIYL